MEEGKYVHAAVHTVPNLVFALLSLSYSKTADLAKLYPQIYPTPPPPEGNCLVGDEMALIATWTTIDSASVGGGDVNGTL